MYFAFFPEGSYKYSVYLKYWLTPNLVNWLVYPAWFTLVLTFFSQFHAKYTKKVFTFQQRQTVFYKPRNNLFLRMRDISKQFVYKYFLLPNLNL